MELVLLEMMFMDSFLYVFKFFRLTLGIGNLMSSHSFSAGHVPLGLGRDSLSPTSQHRGDLHFLPYSASYGAISILA